MPAQTTRFVKSNFATGVAASSAGTPPLEDPLYPALNALNNDRFLKWFCPSASGNIVAVVNVGTGKTTNVLGLLGLEKVAAFPNTLSVVSYATYPNPSIASVT